MTVKVMEVKFGYSDGGKEDSWRRERRAAQEDMRMFEVKTKQGKVDKIRYGESQKLSQC